MAERINEQALENVKEITIMGSKFNMYGDEENPLFLAADVAEMIEYSVDKTHQMVELVDDDEKLTDTIYRGGQQREMWFLTENGLYELLMQSRKPLAKRFKAEIKKALHRIRIGDRNRVFGFSNDLLNIENAHIRFRNFRGLESKVNREGDRNFCVDIDDADLANQLAADGWNVKVLAPRSEDEEPKHFIPVAVRYDNFPPNIYLVTKKNKIRLDENTVGQLDNVDILNVDLTINASHWETNGKSGIKAYVKVMYVTIEEDAFADKYEKEEEDEEFPFY